MNFGSNVINVHDPSVTLTDTLLFTPSSSRVLTCCSSAVQWCCLADLSTGATTSSARHRNRLHAGACPWTFTSTYRVLFFFFACHTKLLKLQLHRSL